MRERAESFENPILEKLSDAERAALPPEWLKSFLPWRDEPESERLPLTESGFTEAGEIRPEFQRLKEIKHAIQQENERRLERGAKPIAFIGIHAAGEDHSPSRLMLDKMLVVPEWLGVETRAFEMGRATEEQLEEIRQAVRESDGIFIATHTKRGVLNPQMAELLDALEGEDLKGKISAFVHTYDDKKRDSQMRPVHEAEGFFREKGSFIMPWTFFYANTGEANEPWLERNFERSGVKILQFMERAAKSQIQEVVRHPEVAEERKAGREISEFWAGLRAKVASINEQREEQGVPLLNALIVTGGEHPKGHSARIAKVLGKNFEYLGVKTDFFSLAEADIAPTKGNPLEILSEEMQEEKANGPQENTMEDAYLRLLKADIVIFASPVRWFDVSGRLQQFIERTIPLEGQGYLLSGKAFGTILTFAEAGAHEAEARLQEYAQANGMMVIPFGGLSFSAEGYEDVRPDVVRNPARMKEIRRAAAMSTMLTADILAADGEKAKKIRWRHDNPFLSIVGPKE